MRNVSRRPGFSLIEVAIYAVVLLIFGSLVSGLGNTPQALRQDAVRNELMAIDQALSTWYMSHAGQYPDRLADLQALGLLPGTINVDNFAYVRQPGGTRYFLQSLDPAEVSPRSREWGFVVN